MTLIDINADVGEVLEHIQGGLQEALLPYLTSVNIACGGHAGTEETMNTTLEQARVHKLRIGAHPGYPDAANFGRLKIDMPFDQVEEFVYSQVRALGRICPELGHVKPHGALYNAAAKDAPLARAIAAGVARYRRDLTLVGLAGSVMLDAFRDAGFAVAAEAFADRRYEPDGSLRSRQKPDALIHDPNEAAEQALRLTRQGGVDTICIHGDTPGAVEIASAVRRALDTLPNVAP